MAPKVAIGNEVNFNIFKFKKILKKNSNWISKRTMGKIS